MGRLLFAIVLISFFSVGCTRDKQHRCLQSKTPESKGEIFLFGSDAAVSPILKTVIETSGIATKGYVLIITGNDDISSEHLSAFISTLSYYKVFAVHQMNSLNQQAHKKSNSLKIENAALIFLIFSNPQNHAEFLSDTSLINSLKKAHSNGITITGIAHGTDIMGDYFIVIPELRNEPPVIVEGLGFVRDVMVGTRNFYENHLETTFELTREADLDFIGIGKTTALQLCKNALLAVVESDLLIISSKKQSQNMRIRAGDFVVLDK